MMGRPPGTVGALPASRRGNGSLRALQLGLPLVLLLGWEGLYRVTGDLVLASPWTIGLTVLDGLRRGWLVQGLHETALALGGAYLLSVALGVWIGVVLGTSAFRRQVLEPVMLTVYAVPKVTLYPVFLLFFGLGLAARVAFGAFHGVFPIAIFTMNAVKGIRPVWLKVAAATGCSGWQTFRHVVVPSVLPSLFSGLRVGFSLTFLGVIISEMFASRRGAGYLLMQAIGLHNIPRLLAVALVLIVFALLVNAGFLAVENRLRRRFGGLS